MTFPLLANLYLICTLLSTIWTLGDFNTVYFVSGGGPALATEVLATLGIRDAFELGNPPLGVAAVMSALPLLIPMVILLMRKLCTLGGAVVSVAAAGASRRSAGRAPARRSWPMRRRVLLGLVADLDRAAGLQHGDSRAAAEGDVFSDDLWPPTPPSKGFWTV